MDCNITNIISPVASDGINNYNTTNITWDTYYHLTYDNTCQQNKIHKIEKEVFGNINLFKIFRNNNIIPFSKQLTYVDMYNNEEYVLAIYKNISKRNININNIIKYSDVNTLVCKINVMCDTISSFVIKCDRELSDDVFGFMCFDDEKIPLTKSHDLLYFGIISDIKQIANCLHGYQFIIDINFGRQIISEIDIIIDAYFGSTTYKTNISRCANKNNIFVEFDKFIVR